MRYWKIAPIMACFVFAPLSHAADLREWIPAVYHNLIVGTSTCDDVLKTLGRPSADGREQDTGLRTMQFRVSDPVPGTLVVYIHRGVLDGLTLIPKNHYGKNEIVHILGQDYQVVHYSVDDCLTSGGSAPLFESPDGPIAHLEYRKRGLAVILHDEQVEAIGFVTKPYGPPHSRCIAGNRKDKKH